MDINESRGNLIECSHKAHIAVVNSKGKLIGYNNDPHKVIYARSSIKPIQALQCVKSGAYDKFNINDKELSLMCASHNSESFHIESVESILNKANLKASSLQCGMPNIENIDIYDEIIKTQGRLLPINHNCSGKHSGMLVSIKAMNENLSDYLEISHPIQQRIVNDLKNICEVDEIIIGKDGCGAPVHALPMDKLAFGYAKMSDKDKLKEDRIYINKVINAMTMYPEMVSGTDTFCTDLMKVFKGRIFGKYGTQGVYLLGDKENKLGICVKIEDGHKPSIFCAVVETLKQLNLINEEELKLLEKYHNPKLLNSKNEVIGEMKSNFKLNIV